ncbi:MAG: 4Fe-4S dicluster domain-containing protein [Bacteroidales bacterium]|nr:4Fe-4S dicluster domain-containing protein [Bacteroidales bacterium]
MNRISIPKHEWDERLLRLLSSYEVYAPVEDEFSIDYLKLDAETIAEVVYNKPKPVTPLKKFFLPVKENVTSGASPAKPVVIIGTPNCDVMALAFLDEIYLDEEYTDPAYRKRRENTTIVSADCLSIQEHCHCTSYGIEPRGNEHSDLSLAVVEEQVILTIYNKKGEKFLENLGIVVSLEPEKEVVQSLERNQAEVLAQLKSQNKNLPDYDATGKLVSAAAHESWITYASTCVSCGACSAICPTCSCFLLIDKPGFEKIRQLDTCQYPGFERVAGGEDALNALPERFMNRYMCKYVWKPQKYQLKACTGCGRCIEACIGQINKNELFVELST